MINVEEIRKDFPIFKRFEKENIVYLDNAATTQKPKSVIDSVVDFYENHNSNVHRGVYRVGEEATDLYNRSRENVAKFIGASENQIIFVRNATEALNLAASCVRKRPINRTEVYSRLLAYVERFGHHL